MKQLMDLVFTLVCNGELSLARVLRKNILDKVEQKKLLRYTNSLKPLAARGVSARYFWGPGSGSDTSMGCVESVPLRITDSVDNVSTESHVEIHSTSLLHMLYSTKQF